MSPDDLRAIMDHLQQYVQLQHDDRESSCTITIDTPTIEEMIAAGLDSDGSAQILNAPWWDEMITDVIETPELCEPDDSPEQILQYARDVIAEYIRKRATL